jgi:outer membrane protein assembly factor BamB
MSFDPNTGQQSWKSRMLALDEATGKQLWTADKLAAGYSGSEQLVLCEGTAYFLGYEQARNRASLEAYDLADGSKRFAAEVSAGGSPGQMQLHAQGDRLLACAGNALQCYDTATGKLRWRSQFPGQWGFLSAVDDARVVCSVLAGNNQSMQLCAFEMDTGKKLWDSAAMAGQMQSPASQNFMGQLGYRFDPAPVTDRVLAVTTNWQTRKSSYAAFDGASGKLLWRTESGGMIGHQVAPPLVGREQAAAFVPGQGKGERRVWDLSSGKLLEKGELPAAYGFVAAQEGAVIQVSNAAIERLVSAAAPAGTGGGKGQ